jgi:hypothetical protein
VALSADGPAGTPVSTDADDNRFSFTGCPRMTRLRACESALNVGEAGLGGNAVAAF